jgi:hypothetical protein
VRGRVRQVEETKAPDREEEMQHRRSKSVAKVEQAKQRKEERLDQVKSRVRAHNTKVRPARPRSRSPLATLLAVRSRAGTHPRSCVFSI